MRSVELFAGAGGLCLATSLAGFSHEAVVDVDDDACATLRENKERGVEHVAHWPIIQADVHALDYRSIRKAVDLLAGGPPCQPFSLGGKHRGHRDERNLFPEAVRGVRELRPRAFVFENVKGLTRASFIKYFEYIVLQLTYPEVTRRAGQAWEDHLARLERHHTRGRRAGLTYQVVYSVLDAANFGVPQRRQRVFLVGFRSDLGVEWSFPKPTHSADALLRAKWITGEYWERHRVARSRRAPPNPREAARLAVVRSELFPVDAEPWQTVRDAIAGLPDPRKPSVVLNHRFQPGARPYKGHTGSRIDEPAKALKAGDHGVPGGENMIALASGGVRYFTVRESARLQTFPDDYSFHGAWTECMRQLGNAVPVQLGFAVLAKVARVLRGSAHE